MSHAVQAAQKSSSTGQWHCSLLEHCSSMDRHQASAYPKLYHRWFACYRDAQDRLLWGNKTCPVRDYFIMSWKLFCYHYYHHCYYQHFLYYLIFVIGIIIIFNRVIIYCYYYCYYCLLLLLLIAYCRRREGAAGLEDGTAHYLGIAAVRHGFHQLSALGGFPAVGDHTQSVTGWVPCLSVQSMAWHGMARFSKAQSGPQCLDGCRTLTIQLQGVLKS